MDIEEQLVKIYGLTFIIFLALVWVFFTSGIARRIAIGYYTPIYDIIWLLLTAICIISIIAIYKVVLKGD